MLKRGVRNGSPGSSFSRPPSRLCSQPATNRYARGTHSGPYGAIEAVGQRAGVPAVPFVPSDGKADEVSAIPGQFHIPKQIGNLPHEVRSSWPGRRPVPAGRPNVACTCDGGSPALAPPQHLRTPPRDAPGPCPRPASMGSPSLFPGGENLSRAEGIQRVRLSETPVTLMHVHLG